MASHIYILRDEKGLLYIGSTNDLERRMKQHLSGHTKTTNRMVSPRLVFSQECTTLTEARSLELKLKRMKRKDYIEKIIADGYIRLSA